MHGGAEPGVVPSADVLKIDQYGDLPAFADASLDVVKAIIEEAGKFTGEVLARVEASAIPIDIAVARAELAQDLIGSGSKAEARTLLAQALPVLREHFLPQHMNRAKFEAMARTLGV